MKLRKFLKEAWQIITGTEPEFKLTEDEIVQTKRLLERLREADDQQDLGTRASD
jgi:hypothetical protein